MQSLRHALCLALVGSGLAASPLLQSSAGAAPAGAEDLLSQMRSSADGATKVTEEESTGKVGFIRVTDADSDLLPGVDGDSAKAAAAKAKSYLDDYAPAFGARADELKESRVTHTQVGWTITYTQEYQGVEVFGAALKANIDKDGQLTAVNGVAVPDIDLSVDPRLNESAAAKEAVSTVKADPPGGKKTDVSGLKAQNAKLVIYRQGLIRGQQGGNNLAWYVEAANGSGVRDAVIMNAGSGKLLNRYSLVHSGLERHLYEETYSPATQIWSEGDPFPGALNQWHQSEVTTTGEAYWMFKNTWGRDSYDGEGHKMETVNNDPRIQCPNANWNGVTTNYCDGTATDDVVAHEWGHAYTQYTGGLIYQWQPGALNESYSDVWGETLDLINGRDDTEQDVSVRPEGDCTPNRGAAKGIKGDRDAANCGTSDSATGGDSFTSGVGGKLSGNDGTASDSYRWMMGEDATAFGGAIRDMWTPTCKGDPGKVSDAQYVCAQSDAGGVHSNSGVPNHAYALLVDGGTYNNTTITGLGLDKAANIWFQAQEAYQVPSTDFNGHADGIIQACDDLVGEDVNKLSTDENNTSPGTVTIEASDCTSVNQVIAATELRKEPTQCNFQPMFDQNTPDLCGEGMETTTVWEEDFEDGIAGWDADVTKEYDQAKNFPWEASDDAPGDNDTGVAFGPTPDGGSCAQDTDDYSTSDGLISQEIALPADLPNGKLSFKHYLATETGFDGGNVKISVNGGDFKVIPNSAYMFNKGVTLQTSQSTNPLRGQNGFTGTDGGQVTGSWATSIVDLAGAGVKGGDKIKLKFDIGRDGCGGIDGWYVDDVKVTTCGDDVPAALPTKTTATHKPEPSKFGKASKVVVKVTAEQGKVNGRVQLRNAKGKVVAKGGLTNGRSVLKIGGKKFPVGKNKATAVYLGNKKFEKSQAKVTITVKRK